MVIFILVPLSTKEGHFAVHISIGRYVDIPHVVQRIAQERCSPPLPPNLVVRSSLVGRLSGQQGKGRTSSLLSIVGKGNINIILSVLKSVKVSRELCTHLLMCIYQINSTFKLKLELFVHERHNRGAITFVSTTPQYGTNLLFTCTLQPLHAGNYFKLSNARNVWYDQMLTPKARLM